MDDSGQPSPIADLTQLIAANEHEAAAARLDRYETADAAERKRVIQALRDHLEDRPGAFGPLRPALCTFLTDDERAVRLVTAKLFVAAAEADPEVVVPAVPSLADRLADEDEFYYVRARSAEALGYVALEDPESVASPAVLADLHVGLSFDEPEVKAKLAKALECVALGDPTRLRHRVSKLAAHFEDDDELVRYHLCTAVTVVGCTDPAALADVREALVARLDDESPFVRGRAAEALGVVARAAAEDLSLPERDLRAVADDEESFASERARFATADASPENIGTVEGVSETTTDAVEEITAPDGDGGCPHCGVALPESGPPMCPRCGAPR